MINNEQRIIGRLGATPELETVGKDNISIARFSVAVSRRKKANEENAKTDWFDCVAWRGTAEYICKYGRKGKLIAVSGAMEKEEYEKDGAKQTRWKLQVEEVSILEWPDKDEEETISSSYDKREESQSEQIKMTPIADDSLPF